LIRQNFVLTHYFSRLNASSFILFLFWSFGMLTGLYVISNATATVLPVIYLSYAVRPTLFSLILTQTLPLLLSCVVCWLGKPTLILPIVFTKAFTFAICTFGVIMAYGDAGWLVRWIILLSDSCSVVFLLWFCLRRLSSRSTSLFNDLLICYIAIVVICYSHNSTIVTLSLNLINF
jgi:hypothetical protein